MAEWCRIIPACHALRSKVLGQHKTRSAFRTRSLMRPVGQEVASTCHHKEMLIHRCLCTEHRAIILGPCTALTNTDQTWLPAGYRHLQHRRCTAVLQTSACHLQWLDQQTRVMASVRCAVRAVVVNPDLVTMRSTEMTMEPEVLDTELASVHRDKEASTASHLVIGMEESVIS